MVRRGELVLILVIISLAVIVLLQSDTFDNFSRYIINNISSYVIGQQQQEQQHRTISSTIIYDGNEQKIGQNYQYVTTAKLNTRSNSTIDNKDSSLTEIFKRVENSVVQIISRTSDNDGMQIIINGKPPKSTRLGSGFVYDKEHHIITNNHVVGGAKKVDVTFIDGNTYTGKVIGSDPFSDIAILQITDNIIFSGEEKDVRPLAIANSSNLEVGQQVIAIGNPFGLSDSMTTGIISQMQRLLPADPNTAGGGFSIPNTIQTDATINPGNSGGPLLNMQGQVIGMNTAISSSTGEFAGVGFAIPSNTITRIVPALLQKGTYSHPWLGISGISITPDIAQSIGLPRNYKGVVVGSVEADGPADKAGLKGAIITTTTSSSSSGANPSPDDITKGGGDIITAIDGHPVKRIDDVISYIEEHKLVGDNVVLTVNRNGQTTDLTATLQSRPTSLRGSD
jgi:S1-C subfamily serine protease